MKIGRWVSDRSRVLGEGSLVSTAGFLPSSFCLSLTLFPFFICASLILFSLFDPLSIPSGPLLTSLSFSFSVISLQCTCSPSGLPFSLSSCLSSSVCFFFFHVLVLHPGFPFLSRFLLSLFLSRFLFLPCTRSPFWLHLSSFYLQYTHSIFWLPISLFFSICTTFVHVSLLYPGALCLSSFFSLSRSQYTRSPCWPTPLFILNLSLFFIYTQSPFWLSCLSPVLHPGSLVSLPSLVLLLWLILLSVTDRS